MLQSGQVEAGFQKFYNTIAKAASESGDITPKGLEALAIGLELLSTVCTAIVSIAESQAHIASAQKRDWKPGDDVG